MLEFNTQVRGSGTSPLATRLLDEGYVKAYLALSFITTSLKDVYEEDGKTPALRRTEDVVEYLLDNIGQIFQPNEAQLAEAYLSSAILGIDPEVSLDPAFEDFVNDASIYCINSDTIRLNTRQALQHLETSPQFYLIKLCDIIYTVFVGGTAEDRNYTKEVLLGDITVYLKNLTTREVFYTSPNFHNVVRLISDCLDVLEEELQHD